MIGIPTLVNPYGVSGASMAAAPDAYLGGGAMVASNGNAIAAPAPRGFQGAPLKWLFGFLILWLGWKFLGEHKSTEINPANLQLGIYDTVGVGLSWVGFWTMTKLISNQFFPSSDLNTFVNWL
jgi:hypothetical protein